MSRWKKAEGLKLYKKTLNRYFINKGEDFPYCEFPEPWFYQASKSLKLGFEIFFTHEFTEYKDSYLPKALKNIDQEAMVDGIAIKK